MAPLRNTRVWIDSIEFEDKSFLFLKFNTKLKSTISRHSVKNVIHCLRHRRSLLKAWQTWLCYLRRWFEVPIDVSIRQKICCAGWWQEWIQCTGKEDGILIKIRFAEYSCQRTGTFLKVLVTFCFWQELNWAFWGTKNTKPIILEQNCIFALLAAFWAVNTSKMGPNFILNWITWATSKSL